MRASFSQAPSRAIICLPWAASWIISLAKNGPLPTIRNLMINTYYETKAAPPGSSLYYSVLFSPPEQRQAIIAIYAFYQEISNIIDSCSDLQVAQTKLEWWKTEIIRLFDGEPRHPITKALLPIIHSFQIPLEILHSLIDHPDAEHVTKLIALYIPGGHQTALASYVQDLAQAMQLMDYIIHFQKFSNPFSMGDLTQHTQLAQKHYQNSLNALPAELRHTQLSQIIFAELQLKLLEEIRKDGFNVLTHKIQLTPLRKLWTAWRIMRREKKIY
jgi:phytoene synthase